jgi:hypothetical protein
VDILLRSCVELPDLLTCRPADPAYSERSATTGSTAIARLVGT